LPYEDLFYDISKDAGAVLMTNHAENVETARLYERKLDRAIVTGPKDFPDIAIDWDKARGWADCFRAPVVG
jgi:hypothetical protein